jgi:hypothetical protein
MPIYVWKVKNVQHQSLNNIHSHENGNNSLPRPDVTQKSLLPLLLCPYHELYPSFSLKQQYPAHSPSLHQENMSRIKLLCQELPKLSVPLPPLRTFTLFPELPKELRHEIWRLAAFVSRDVKLWTVKCGRTSSRIPGQTQHPGIVQASNESRTHALKYYTRLEEKCPQLRDGSEDTNDRFRNTLFVNFAVDRFFYDMGWSYRIDGFNIDPVHLDLLKHCARRIELTKYAGENFSLDFMIWMVFDTLCEFKNLKELTLVCSDWASNGEEQTISRYLQREDVNVAIRYHHELEWSYRMRNAVTGVQTHQVPVPIRIQWIFHEECDLSPCAAGQKRFEEVGEALPSPP